VPVRELNLGRRHRSHLATCSLIVRLIKCINVDAHRQDVLNKLLKSAALSLRTQIDKIYILAKSVDECDFFLGVAEQEPRGAVGILNAVKHALSTTFGKDGLKLLLHVSSIVTDGASINIGHKNGLWSLFEAERYSQQTAMSRPVLPLAKVWCAVHRSQLAWLSVTVIEVKLCFQILIGLVTFFHTSGVRTRELKKLAADNQLELRQLPTVYEVRWTEFSYALLNSVLVSWKALVSYLKHPVTRCSSNGAHELSNIIFKPAVFLADVLFVYERFQIAAAK